MSLCTVLFCWSLIMPGGARFSLLGFGGELHLHGLLVHCPRETLRRFALLSVRSFVAIVRDYYDLC